MFRGCRWPTRLLHCPSPGHEDRLHTQVTLTVFCFTNRLFNFHISQQEFLMCGRYSGVLSAYGLALADVVEEVQEPCSLQYEQRSFPEIDKRVEQLSKRCHDTLCTRGFGRSAPVERSPQLPVPPHPPPLVTAAAILTPCVFTRPQRSDHDGGFPPPALRRHRLRPHGHGCRLPQQRPVLSCGRLPQQLHQAVSC